jgi:cytochrome c peroxidase
MALTAEAQTDSLCRSARTAELAQHATLLTMLILFRQRRRRMLQRKISEIRSLILSTAEQQVIGEGEEIFNNRTFTITNVQGLNGARSDPLYNPADPLADKSIVGTCSTCHNTPDVGNHSTSLLLNIGTTTAVPVDNRGQPIPDILDTTNLPIYTLKSSAGSVVSVTDPGRALITGQWVDVGKVKVPVLRGLAARPPYFHNGSARDLATVVSFYNARFSIGLTPQESSALVLFLSAL